MAEQMLKENPESNLERFVSHFRGITPKKSTKKTLEENLIWSYLINNLDEKKVSSTDLSLMISVDYCLDLKNLEKSDIYKLIPGGNDITLDYCIEKLCISNVVPLRKKDNKTQTSASYNANISLKMLYHQYKSLLKNKEAADLLSAAQNIDDLKSIVLIDNLIDRMDDDLVVDLLSQDISIGQKVGKAIKKSRTHSRSFLSVIVKDKYIETKDSINCLEIDPKYRYLPSQYSPLYTETNNSFKQLWQNIAEKVKYGLGKLKDEPFLIPDMLFNKEVNKKALIIATTILFSGYGSYKLASTAMSCAQAKPNYSYVVKKGDYLSLIAKKCCKMEDWPAIYKQNNLKSDVIHPGQKLIIPGYLVKHEYGLKEIK